VFSSWLDNLKIRSKLQLLLVPLVLLLLLLSVQIVVDRWYQYRAVHTSLKSRELIQLFTNLVHELQIERGISEGHIGSDGTKFMNQLQQQRRLVDVRIEMLRNFIRKHTSLVRSILKQQEVDKILVELDSLSEVRLVVDSQDTSRRSFYYYSNFNARTLHLIRHVSLEMDNTLLMRYANALGTLMWLQEYAGRERAILSRMFASGRVDDTRAIQITLGYIANQESLLNQFYNSEADHSEVARLKKALDDSAVHQVHEIRQAITAIGYLQRNVSEIKFTDWFRYASRRIELVRQVSDGISEDMAVHAKQVKDTAYVELISYSLLAVMSLGAALFLSFIISRHLVKGLTTINEALKNVRDTGDLTVQVQECGDDEVSSIIYSFNSMIEERKRIDKALHQSQKQLQLAMEESEKANQAKSEFLSRMSHELRTPMNAILGFGQLLELDKELGPDRKASVHEILMAGKHLLELINDVLDLAKIESGHINVAYQEIDCHSLLADAMQLVNPLAVQRNITLRYEPDLDETAFIHVDPNRLKEVMLNLLSNAIKYNRKDGVVTVSSMKSSDDYYRIEVSDNGEGLSEEQMQRLFQPFERLGAENSTIEGTGIGLVICKRILAAMGGSIGVESIVGQGSTFWVEARLSGKLCERPGDQLVAEQNSRFSCDIPDCKVLYIEDNPSSIRLMEHIFDNYTNISLISTMAPDEVLALVKIHHPSLILMDINLPGMSGVELIKLVRECEDANDTLVVAVSANAMNQDIEKAMAAGFDDYLTKPVDISHFIKLLTNLLHKPDRYQNNKKVQGTGIRGIGSEGLKTP